MITASIRHFCAAASSPAARATPTSATPTTAAALSQALPYLRALQGQYLVVMVDGPSCLQPALREALLRDLASLHQLGARPLLVQGAAPQLQDVAGHRTPPPAALRQQLARGMLAELNLELVRLLSRSGLQAVGLSGYDTELAQADTQPDATGLHGVAKLRPDILRHWLGYPAVPVLMPLAPNAHGQETLLSPEALAISVAQQIGARHLLFLHSQPRYAELSAPLSDAPSLEACLHAHPSHPAAPVLRHALAALAAGLPAVHLLDAAEPHGLLDELSSPDGSGLLLCQRGGTQWLADMQRYFRDSEAVLHRGLQVESKRVVRF